MGLKFDKGIVPKRCEPLRVKNEEGLLWLGSANLLRMREFWLDERKDLAIRRKKEMKKSKKSDKVFNYVHGLTERIDCRTSYLTRLAKKADWKPLVPLFRELNHFVDGRFCYVLVDNEDGMEPGFIPARVAYVVGATMVVHPICDLGIELFANVYSAEVFSASELGYLREHDEYRDFIAHFCFTDDKEIEIWDSLVLAAKPDVLDFLDCPDCISPGHFD